MLRNIPVMYRDAKFLRAPCRYLTSQSWQPSTGFRITRIPFGSSMMPMVPCHSGGGIRQKASFARPQKNWSSDAFLQWPCTVRQMSTHGGGPGNGRGQSENNQFKGTSPNEDTQDHSSRDELDKAIAGGAQGLAIWVALLFFCRTDLKQDTHEITMQELLKDYVVKGLVDKIEVVNRSVCLAHVRADAYMSMGFAHEKQQPLSVQLDTVRKFEDKIEQVQLELGLQTTEMMPVHYVQYSDYSSRLLLSLIVVSTYFFLASL